MLFRSAGLLVFLWRGAQQIPRLAQRAGPALVSLLGPDAVTTTTLAVPPLNGLTIEVPTPPLALGLLCTVAGAGWEAHVAWPSGIDPAYTPVALEIVSGLSGPAQAPVMWQGDRRPRRFPPVLPPQPRCRWSCRPSSWTAPGSSPSRSPRTRPLAPAEFRNVQAALAAGYLATDVFVAAPGLGGMGYHYANPGHRGRLPRVPVTVSGLGDGLLAQPTRQLNATVANHRVLQQAQPVLPGGSPQRFSCQAQHPQPRHRFVLT